MKSENNTRRFYFLIFMIAMSSINFASPIFAQSIFSGLILSERKDGLKVIDVQKGSPSFDAGLKSGDVILEIDGKKIKSLDDYVIISSEIKDKKVEASLTVVREGVSYEAVIIIYSVPIHHHWEEKVSKPKELPQGLTNSPYTYWTNKGNRILKKTNNKASFEAKVGNYNEAIKYLYNGLHYQPKSIGTAIQIAKSYHELGNTYLNNGVINKGIKSYKDSIRLYANCLKKTQNEDYLKLILTSLQEIEKELGKIDTNEAKPPLETNKGTTIIN
ncbi:MAG: PDZ domain-containing protein [Candidatus Scalinduaceae bacterium]